MGNAPPQGGYEKLAPTHANTLPAWRQLRGYHTIQWQVPQRLRPSAPDRGSGRLGRVVRLRRPEHVPLLRLHAERERQARHYGTTAGDHQADVYTAKAVDAVKRLAARTEPSSSPSRTSRRTPACRASRTTRRTSRRRSRRLVTGTASRRSRCRRTPAFDEADVSTSRSRAGAGRSRRAADRGHRGDVPPAAESLLAVDEGVAAIVRALAGQRRARPHAHRLHLGQRLLPRRAPDPEREVQHYEPSARVPLVRAARASRAARGSRSRPSTSTWRRRRRPGDAKAGQAGRRRSLLALLADGTRFGGRDVLLETPTYAAIHTPRYVYVEHNTGERELYDLAYRPDELASQHENPAYAQIRSDLARRLLTLRACKAAGCRRGPALSVTSRCAGGKHRVVLAGGEAGVVTRVDWIYRGQAAGAARKSAVPGRAARSCGRRARERDARRRPPRIGRPPARRLR